MGSESEDEGGDDTSAGVDIDDAEHDQMEHWLDEFEDMEEKHKQKLERGTRRGGGHKGAVEVSVYGGVTVSYADYPYRVQDEEEDDFDFVSSTLYDLEDGEEGEDGAEIMAGDFFGSNKSKAKKGCQEAMKAPARKALARAAGEEEEEEDDYYNDESDDMGIDGGSDEDDDNEGVFALRII